MIFIKILNFRFYPINPNRRRHRLRVRLSKIRQMMKNKIHLGLEAMYQYVNFAGEGNKLIVETAAGGTTATNTTLGGDIIRFQAILGFNF